MFVGKDVAQALGYKNPSNALQVYVDSEDKTSYLIQVSGSAYKANTLFINESGPYSLILSSKLPQAKTFNMAVGDFNAVLCDMGIQYRRGGHWNIADDLADRDLVRLRTYVSYSLKGEKKVRTYMTWTMSGLRFLNAKLGYPNF